MQTLVAFIVGGLLAGSLYLMMRRNVVKLIIGLGLLTHAANLLIFSIGGIGESQPPIVPIETGPTPAPIKTAEAAGTLGGMANPLPQALILTAIVIGFAAQAFAMVLIQRAVQTLGTDDVDQLNTTDRYASADYAKTP